MSTKPEVASVTHLPINPSAGKSFVMIVELDREVTADERVVEVVFEKQRIVPDIGGFPITRPTGSQYFEPGFEPGPIQIIVSKKYGVSNPIIVRKDAAAGEGEVPVSFPEKLLMTAFLGNLAEGFCSDLMNVRAVDAPTLTFALPDDLTLGQKVPNKAEKDVVGAATSKIVRGTPEFAALVENKNADVDFKDEEGTGADRMMTTKLKGKVDSLAALVKSEWPGIKLRITEAWDEGNEHGANSVHYEARAADLTTSDKDAAKLGRLGRLAVNAGFDWVFYEDNTHIHASMSK